LIVSSASREVLLKRIDETVRSGRADDLLAWFVAFATPLLVLPVPGGHRIGLAPFLAVAVPLFVLYRRPTRVPLAAWLSMVLILAVWASIFVVPARHRLETLVNLGIFTGIWITPWLAALPGARMHDRMRYIRAFVAGGGIALAVGLLLFVLQVPTSAHTQWFTVYGVDHVIRAAGLIGSTGQFALLVVCWVIMACTAVLEVDGRGKRHFLFVLAILFGTTMLVLNSSRTGVLAITTVGGAACMMYVADLITTRHRARRSSRVVLGAGAASVLLVAVAATSGYLASAMPSNRFVARFSQPFHLIGSAAGYDAWNRATGNRLENWAGYWQMWKGDIALGHGYKAAEFVSSPPYIDNAYLALLLESGVLSLCTFLALVGYMIFGQLIGGHGSKESRAIALAWTAVAVFGITANVHTFWAIIPALLLLGALPARQDRGAGAEVAFSE